MEFRADETRVARENKSAEIHRLFEFMIREERLALFQPVCGFAIRRIGLAATVFCYFPQRADFKRLPLGALGVRPGIPGLASARIEFEGSRGIHKLCSGENGGLSLGVHPCRETRKLKTDPRLRAFTCVVVAPSEPLRRACPTARLCISPRPDQRKRAV